MCRGCERVTLAERIFSDAEYPCAVCSVYSGVVFTLFKFRWSRYFGTEKYRHRIERGFLLCAECTREYLIHDYFDAAVCCILYVKNC